MTERRRSAESALEALCRPRRVAIVGGSADPTKIAGRPVRFLRRAGYSGQGYLVNPGLPEVEGLHSVASVGELPETPDAAFVALATNAAISAVGELAAIGTPAAIVLAAGFSESGAEGAVLERRLLEAAGAMRLLGPNTLGLVNLTDGVLLTASDALESPGISAGSLAVAAQSGGLMASMLSRAAGRGIAFSTLFATGNEADLEITDCLEYLTKDPATAVIALYLETLRDPARFVTAARRAVEVGKPVFAYKVGRSEAGARAASSHTGALAGSDRAFDALFEQAGVIRVARFSELLEIPAAVAAGKPMRGGRVGVLTTTGGAGTLIADACGTLGLELPPPSERLASALGELLPGADLHGNPIDLTLAGTRREVMAPVIELLSAGDEFDALVVIIGSSAVAQPRLVADPLIACAARPGARPLLAYVSPYLPEVIDRLNRAGVPAFDAPESCAAALLALSGGAAKGVPVPPWRALTPPGSEGALVNEAEAKELLARHGIASPRRVLAHDPEEAAALIGGLTPPLAVKVLAAALVHKSDAGGVALGVGGDGVRSAAEGVLANVRASRPEATIEGLLVEEMAPGIEVILGMVRDPALGAVVLLGSGGITAELVDDTVLALPPIDGRRAEEMLSRLRISRLLDGARGQPPADRRALVEAIVAFSSLLEALGERLEEIEINPLVVRPVGEGVLALDALVAWRGDGSASRRSS